MPRHSERQLQLIDLVGRFEAQSSQVHVYNALACIERLRCEGRALLEPGSNQMDRWEKGCGELWRLLNTLGMHRDIKKVDLQTVMRNFFEKFEHHTGRMLQIAYGTAGKSDENTSFQHLSSWIEMAFRTSSYAIVSAWLPDKWDETSVRININLSTGETNEVFARKEMRVPRKHKKATKPI